MVFQGAFVKPLPSVPGMIPVTLSFRKNNSAVCAQRRAHNTCSELLFIAILWDTTDHWTHIIKKETEGPRGPATQLGSGRAGLSPGVTPGLMLLT